MGRLCQLSLVADERQHKRNKQTNQIMKQETIAHTIIATFAALSFIAGYAVSTLAIMFTYVY